MCAIAILEPVLCGETQLPPTHMTFLHIFALRAYPYVNHRRYARTAIKSHDTTHNDTTCFNQLLCAHLTHSGRVTRCPDLRVGFNARITGFPRTARLISLPGIGFGTRCPGGCFFTRGNHSCLLAAYAMKWDSTQRYCINPYNHCFISQIRATDMN